VLRDLFFCSCIFIEEGLGLERLWAWRGPTTMTVMETGASGGHAWHWHHVMAKPAAMEDLR